MSRALSLGLIALALVAYHSSFAKTTKTRPARVNHTSKLTAPMNIEVEMVGPPPQQAGDVYDLKGTVRSKIAAKGVKLEWQLGSFAEIVAGEKSQTVDLEAGQEIHMQIKVKALSLGSQQVKLQASSAVKDARMSAFGRVKDQTGVKASSGEKNSSTPVESKKKQRIFQ